MRYNNSLIIYIMIIIIIELRFNMLNLYIIWIILSDQYNFIVKFSGENIVLDIFRILPVFTEIMIYTYI